MEFIHLVQVFKELESTTSRNVMTETLAELFRAVSTEEVRETSYLLLGQMGPMFARTDFGLAEKMVERAIARVCVVDVSKVHSLFKDVGDLGEAAERLLGIHSQTASKTSCSVGDIYTRLMEIAAASGAGSQDVKVERLAVLLGELSADESKYVVRMVLGKMRLGFSDKTILDALAVMEGGSKAGREDLDYAYQVSPDIGWVAEQVKTVGIKQLKVVVRPAVGVPVIPALAQRLKTADEMIHKMGKVMVEAKFDGTRTQIHFKRNDFIKTYARSLEETTAMFPELIEAAKQLDADSVIIDAEAIGYDPKTGLLRPFQETITRKRKHGVVEASEQIPIKFFCFDILFLNDESLISKPLYERRKLLESVVQSGSVLTLDGFIVTDKAAEVRAFHGEKLAGGLEGAMVKKYDGEYQPGRTGWNWVKFKEEETAEGKLSDTIDALVMGYYKGKGKRSNFGIGAFLVGVINEDSTVTVAKIGTGLSDDQWRELRRRADEHFAMEKPPAYTVAAGLEPDVWVEPSIVVEIAADEITKSPLHSSGFGLRFPRLVKFRDDKHAGQTTTLTEVQQIGNLG